MLADAATLHLDLQLRLIKHGYSLKDASAFNVSFNGPRPVFMDIPSIEIPRRRDVWVAYGQFCRMFIFPLLLHHQRGVDFRQCFQTDLNGPSVALTRRILGWSGALRPAAVVDVFMQYLLHLTAERRSGSADAAKFNSPVSGSPRAQELNLMRLRNKLCSMSARSPDASSWAGYEQTKSYDTDGNEVKADFVEKAWNEFRPARVLDLGCNTGRYSELAAACGAAVTAVDSDHDCIDMLYKRVRTASAGLLPLCIDITNPSPALGFRHRERKSFEDRADFDGVMALALVHHLLVAARIPLSEIRDLLAALALHWLIVEYVDPRDSMFQRLLATRENLYGDLTREKFEAVFSQTFEIIRTQPVLNGHRVLYLMRKR
jgi:SAM-dependent methyltransferase